MSKRGTARNGDSGKRRRIIHSEPESDDGFLHNQENESSGNESEEQNGITTNSVQTLKLQRAAANALKKGGSHNNSFPS